MVRASIKKLTHHTGLRDQLTLQPEGTRPGLMPWVLILAAHGNLLGGLQKHCYRPLGLLQRLAQIPPRGGLEQRKFILSQFRRLGVRDIRKDNLPRSLSSATDGRPPSCCVLTRPFLCRRVSAASSLVKTQIRLNQEPTLMAAFNVITSLEARLQVQSPWGLKTQLTSLGEAQFRP